MARRKNAPSSVEDAPVVLAVETEPDLPVSDGMADAVIAPPVEPVDRLDTGEVIRKEKEQTIRIDGKVFHHVREALDGRWIYAPLKSAGQ